MSETLTGFRRADGRWGVRNHVLVMPVRAAANLAAARIATAAGAVSVGHSWDGEATPDLERLQRTFIGFASNPNVSSVLAVGVTEEDSWLSETIKGNAGRCYFISLAGCRGIAAAIERGTTLARAAVADARALAREPMSPGELMLGLECGGSDALSGITANPALGVASDLLVEAGGTSVLAETPELIGAEKILSRRAISPEVGRAVIDVIVRFEEAIAELGVDVRGAQPTPGNQAGGLTTIEEKSLGAAKKGGGAPISGVVEYAARPARKGLNIMDTPGQDIEQMVGMVAGGCQLVAFTTGRGTPTGSPIAPCLKISTNTTTFERMAGDIDLDAGVILEGEETVRSMGERIYAAILAVAAGEQTASERRGNREFAISRTVYPVAA